MANLARREPHDWFDLNRRFWDDNWLNFVKPNDFGVDIKETDTAYELTADMPGFTKQDIAMDFDKDTLSISARQEEDHEEEDEHTHYLRKERSSRSFVRQFNFPNVKEEAITAHFEDGVLTVELPKSGEVKPEKKRILIN